MKLLCLSNGHGEDLIAVKILQQLHQQQPEIELAALPLVGVGYAYRQSNIPIIGPIQKMPSGGFIYMDGKQLWRDMQYGLLQLTLAQFQVVRQWGKSQEPILAVGDLFPLLLACLSGCNCAFVGTAKSEYYLRDEKGWLSQTSWLERYFASVYLPWERWFMSRKACKAVFPRDHLTSQILQNWSIPVFDLGNPMMDEFNSPPTSLSPHHEQLIILLLPGSRVPEVEHNWHLIISAIQGILEGFNLAPVIFLAAIAPHLDLQFFSQSLMTQGWQSQSFHTFETLIDDNSALAFKQSNSHLILTQHSYQQSLFLADVAIAMAGTATEQFVGLGKPVITIPGKGPQFTYAFAEAQSRLLGISVTLVEQPKQVTDTLKSLMTNPDLLHLIANNGKQRLGQPGASSRIANILLTNLIS